MPETTALPSKFSPELSFSGTPSPILHSGERVKLFETISMNQILLAEVAADAVARCGRRLPARVPCPAAAATLLDLLGGICLIVSIQLTDPSSDC